MLMIDAMLDKNWHVFNWPVCRLNLTKTHLTFRANSIEHFWKERENGNCHGDLINTHSNWHANLSLERVSWQWHQLNSTSIRTTPMASERPTSNQDPAFLKVTPDCAKPHCLISHCSATACGTHWTFVGFRRVHQKRSLAQWQCLLTWLVRWYENRENEFWQATSNVWRVHFRSNDFFQCYGF